MIGSSPSGVTCTVVGECIPGPHSLSMDKVLAGNGQLPFSPGPSGDPHCCALSCPWTSFTVFRQGNDRPWPPHLYPWAQDSPTLCRWPCPWALFSPWTQGLLVISMDIVACDSDKLDMCNNPLMSGATDQDPKIQNAQCHAPALSPQAVAETDRCRAHSRWWCII